MPKDNARLADQLRHRLEQDIFSGALPPGTRLDENSLAERFAVSRTPVREALLQLSSNGLITMRPRQGAVVAGVTVRELLQLFEVMAELEALCARLAARRMSANQRAELRALHKRCQVLLKRGDVDQYYMANQAFHEAIYQGARNDYLARMTLATRNRAAPYRRFQLHHPGRLETSWQEHDGVVEAIAVGDAGLAAERMRAHIAIQGDLFTDLVAALPPSYLRAEAG